MPSGDLRYPLAALLVVALLVVAIHILSSFIVSVIAVLASCC